MLGQAQRLFSLAYYFPSFFQKPQEWFTSLNKTTIHTSLRGPSYQDNDRDGGTQDSIPELDVGLRDFISICVTTQNRCTSER